MPGPPSASVKAMKKMRVSSFLALSLPLLVGGLSALGASTALAAECPTSPPDQAKERRGLAREWFARAEAAENAGKDVEAVRAYSCSMRMAAHPFTVYNLARVAERSGDVELALKSYQAYLTLKPDAEDKEEVESKIRDLQTKIKEVKEMTGTEEPPSTGALPPDEKSIVPGTPPDTETPSVEEEPRVAPPEHHPARPVAREPLPQVTEHGGEGPGSSHILEWVVGGVAVGALATGFVMNIVARSDMDTCNNKGEANPACDSAKTAAYTSYAMFGIAGAAAVVEGVLLYRIWASGGDSSDDTSVSLGWLPGGLSLSARGRF